jgi:hypothetical protein
LTRGPLALFAAAAGVQLALCALPDSTGDVLSYRLWARVIAREGLGEAYWPASPLVMTAERFYPPVDYPPVVPCLLGLAGRAADVLSLSDRGLEFLVRVPFVLANLALGVLLLTDAGDRVPARTAASTAALYLFNPGIVFDTAYWGQADALVALFVVGAVVALGRDRPEWAWASLALAVLTKPLAYPFAPLLLLVTLKRYGARRTALCAGVFVAVAAVLFLPFAWIGRLQPLLRSLFLQLHVLPFASVNAHNLWWLVEKGSPWLDAREKAFGRVSYEMIGLGLLAVFYAATLVRVLRSSGERGIRLAFASTAFGFFVLATHMHENHLFNAVPLLLAAGVEDRRVRRFFVLVTFVLLANMALHDPILTAVFRPLAPGPRLLLPLQLGLDPVFLDYFRANGYLPLFAQMRGETSWPGVFLTIVNAQTAVLGFAWWLWSFYRKRSFDAALAEPSRLPRRPLVAAGVLLFLAATGIPFLARAAREDRAASGSTAAADGAIA